MFDLTLPVIDWRLDTACTENFAKYQGLLVDLGAYFTLVGKFCLANRSWLLGNLQVKMGCKTLRGPRSLSRM